MHIPVNERLSRLQHTGPSLWSVLYCDVLSLSDSDQPVYKSDVVSVTGNGSLVISSAKMAHNGRYKCLASNNRGMAEMGMELKIMPREGE